MDQAYITVSVSNSVGEAHGFSTFTSPLTASNFSVTASGVGSVVGIYNNGSGLRRYSQGSMVVTGQSNGGYGIITSSSAEVEGDGLVARVTASESSAFAVYTGSDVNLRLSNCHLSATNYGLYNPSAASTSYIWVDNSRLSATSALANLTNNITYVGSTLLDGIVSNSGSLTCYQCFDQSMSSLSCP